MYNYQGIFFRSNFEAEGNLKRGTSPYRIFCLFVIAFLLFSASEIFAQGVGVNSSGNPPHSSAILDASATDKGMLIPRMTTAQRTVITTPATGLIVYDTDTSSFWYYNGTAWTEIGGSNAGDITDVTAGNGLTGGATTGNATLDVGAGAGITVNANDVSLSTSGVTAGSYTSSNITVDAYGRVTAAASGSSGGCTMSTYYRSNDASDVLTCNNTTIAYFSNFYIPCSITTNKLTVRIQSPSGAVTLKFALYSEDGQAKYFEVATPNITSDQIVTMSLGSSVTLTPGRYYIGTVLNTGSSAEPQADYYAGNLYTSGLNVSYGRLTVTSGTLPATFNPASLTVHSRALIFRLDN